MAEHYRTEVAIIGAGLTGITTALELLDQGKSVLVLDAAPEHKFGGLANNAFGGMLLNGTREQKRLKVQDSPELMLADWLRAAEFGPQHDLQRRWAEAYAYRSTEEVYQWLAERDINFFRVVNWVERGDFQPGNSVPRYHVAWGCGRGVVQTLIGRLRNHHNADRLSIVFEHYVEGIEQKDGKVNGCHGNSPGGEFQVSCEHLVMGCGGINGNLDKVRQHWDPVYGPFPENILNGGDPVSDGALHDRVQELGGRVENLGWMWNYATGIDKPDPEFDNEGLALIPPRSALWLDAYGRRAGPDPMMGAFDTHRLCKRMGHLPHQYGWLVLNWKIAIREMAISGSDMNPNFRDKKFFKVILGTLLGAKGLVNWMIDECPDVVTGHSLDELARQMNRLAGESRIDLEGMAGDIGRYDALIKQGKMYFADDQIRRIAQARLWIGDRLRTAHFRPIVDPKAGPLIAIRLRLLSRKSMGGMVTDLNSQVLDAENRPIPGLYAAGEAAGFGGGGISGVRSLEGTFLPNCIFGGRIAAATICGR